MTFGFAAMQFPLMQKHAAEEEEKAPPSRMSHGVRPHLPQEAWQTAMRSSKDGGVPSLQSSPRRRAHCVRRRPSPSGRVEAELRGQIEKWALYFPHSSFVAIRAPSASASSFAHTIVGCTRLVNGVCAKPQSVPAMTFSRPTSLARRTSRSGHQFRMLDDIADMAHDTGDQLAALRQFRGLPHAPFVFVAQGLPFPGNSRRRSRACTRSTMSFSPTSVVCGVLKLPQQM